MLEIFIRRFLTGFTFFGRAGEAEVVEEPSSAVAAVALFLWKELLVDSLKTRHKNTGMHEENLTY